MIGTIATLFFSFFKIGLFTVGGGLVVVPLIRSEMLARGWLSDAQFLDILGIAQATPGPIGVNTATFVGYRVPQGFGCGFWWSFTGAAAATLAVSLSSVACVLLFGAWFGRNREKPWMRRAFSVIRPAVSLFVLWAGVRLSHDCLGSFSPVAAAVFALGFGLTFSRRVSPLWSLLAGAALGLVCRF